MYSKVPDATVAANNHSVGMTHQEIFLLVATYANGSLIIKNYGPDVRTDSDHRVEEERQRELKHVDMATWMR